MYLCMYVCGLHHSDKLSISRRIKVIIVHWVDKLFSIWSGTLVVESGSGGRLAGVKMGIYLYLCSCAYFCPNEWNFYFCLNAIYECSQEFPDRIKNTPISQRIVVNLGTWEYSSAVSMVTTFWLSFYSFKFRQPSLWKPATVICLCSFKMYG